MNNLLQRAITALVGVAIIITALVYSPYGFAAVFLMIMLLTLKEFYQLAKASGRSPYELWGIGFAFICFMMVFFSYQSDIDKGVFWFLPALFALVFIYPLQKLNNSHAIQCLGISILGVVYIALPFVLLSSIAFISGSYNYILILGILFLQWANDTGAYFAGKAFGKRKLFEKVSPNKTWEGTIGGFILSQVIAFAFHYWFGELLLWQWVVLAAIVSVFGSIGDLAESHFKRTLAIKDSGSSLPGHGGFLDRFDGLLLSIPFTVAYLHFIL